MTNLLSLNRRKFLSLTAAGAAATALPGFLPTTASAVGLHLIVRFRPNTFKTLARHVI